jgi:hypothetical protein
MDLLRNTLLIMHLSFLLSSPSITHPP